MAYKHGVYTSETPTSIVPPVNTTGGLPVVIGTAPVHLATDRVAANKPVLCYTYAEAVAQFGYSEDKKAYTLCEAVKCMFSLYNRAPMVLINVLDPAVHKTAVTNSEINLTDKVAKIEAAVLLETLVVKKASAGQPLVKGTDYEAEYNDDEQVVVTALEGGEIASATSIFVSYDKVDASKVSADDIVGGIDVSSGASKGLECINEVFTETRLVPGTILAPGWSDNPEVGAVMKAKAGNINSCFKAITLNDVPTGTVKKYTDVPSWKDQNNYTDTSQVLCWPMVRMGDDIYHMSTHLMGVMAQVDSANDDIPYESPSNKSMQINGLCLADGTEVSLTLDQANYLNGQGIVTALNFLGGWKCWGNRTCCYPSNTDPKDAFISIRRMFNWHAQTFIQTYWANVDKPTNKRLIQTLLDSENMRLNGLAAQQIILGGRVEFRQEENPTTDLLDGKIKFHTYLTPPVPAREIDNVLEFDPDYFSALFE